MATASEVPGRFDVVIAGEGYVCADLEEIKAQYGFTPTFVQRSAVQGDYGDTAQDFWLTTTQRDWSQGEQQKFYRQSEQKASKYWRGTNVNVNREGAVTIRPAVSAITSAAAITACSPQSFSASTIAYTTATNLYHLASDGTISDKGAHSLGVAPAVFALCTDGTSVYMSSAVAPSVGVRRWDNSAFSTFSATRAIALEFLNNTLYGIGDSANLIRYDTAGVASTLYSWNTATGADAEFTPRRLRASGGKLLILFGQAGKGGAELHSYDGVAPVVVAQFPRNFTAYDLEVVNGVAFVSGKFLGAINEPAVYLYAAGSVELLWRAHNTVSANAPSLAPFDGGLVFNDDSTGQLIYYNPATGGVHSFGAYTASGQGTLAASSTSLLLMRDSGTANFQYPSTTSLASSASIIHSLVDFDSSLTKNFRGVKVDFDVGTTGDGGSVGISYLVGKVDGDFLELQASAVSGTEYTDPTIGTAIGTGTSIAVKVTLNKGTSTDGPTLKRVSVRAAPVQFAFRKETFVLNCTGRDGQSHVTLRDGTTHPKDGLEMATALRTAATTAAPISITDEFGTFTGIIDSDGFQLRRVKRQEFIAVVPVREV